YILGFWDFVSMYTPDLSAFCTKVYAICINTSLVERLFSAMGLFHTNKRNRFAMSQIKGEFQWQKRLENISHANKKFKTTNVVIPVIQEQQEDGVSDDNDDFFDQDPECDIESSREWRNLIKEWIKMVGEDEKIDQTDEENSENLEPLIDHVMNLNQILRKQHPLTNKNAKWEVR
ncbi:286_t:CDS:2, partial [Rhizophagus irregularis]